MQEPHNVLDQPGARFNLREFSLSPTISNIHIIFYAILLRQIMRLTVGVQAEIRLSVNGTSMSGLWLLRRRSNAR
jgi:hypothetical protein